MVTTYLSYMNYTLTVETFKPRRSIIFLTTDASELNVGTQEWIEENEREFGERVVAYVNIGGMRHNGIRHKY